MHDGVEDTLTRCVANLQRLAEDPMREAAAVAFAEAEKREERVQTLRRLSECGFPMRAATTVLDASDAMPLRTTKTLAEARRFYGSDRTLFILSGGVGTGKTFAAVWWAMQPHAMPSYLRRSFGPRFMDAVQLSRMPRYDEGRAAELAYCSALVIDDLGEEYADAKGCFLSDLSALVDVRYRNGLGTFVTTNVNPAEFRTRYGERVRDRIHECGSFVSVREESMRGKA
jgi:DNA replication protein DnaC